MNEKQSQAEWIMAEKMCPEYISNNFSKKHYEKVKDNMIFRGKISWETWKKWYSEHKDEILDRLNVNEYLDFDGNIIKIKKENKPDKEFEVIWQKDLDSYKLPEVDWLVDKLIPNKAVGVWTGKRGTFKTFLTLTMAVNASQGTSFLGQYKTRKCKVLYLDKENGTSIMKTRSKMIINGMDIKENVDIGYICFSQLKIDKNTDIWAIEDVIKQNDIGLLIIDTYRRAISFDENDAGNVSKLFVDVLRPIVEKNNCSIVLIHHDKKGNGEGDEMDLIRGSSDLANYCDFILKNDRKGKSLILKQLKCRHAPEIEPVSINYQTDEKTYFKFSHMGNYAFKSTSDSYSDKIMVWIESSKIREFRTSDIQTFVIRDKIGRTNINEALKTLESNGIIEKIQKGKWRVLDYEQNRL